MGRRNVYKKGLSPLIAVVLLIAFTVGIAGLVLTWLGTLSGKQMEKTSEVADKQILCSRSFLDITEVKYGTVSNVTLRYTLGTEDLYNFTLTFIDNTGQYYATPVANVTPQYNDTEGQRFKPGMIAVWNINTSSLTGSSLSRVYVSALCQKIFPVSTECKAGKMCMG